MNPDKPRILAIDDIPLNLMTLGAALSQEFDLHIASSGPQGIKLALQSPPELILLDIMMPGMDGFETCRRIKAEPLLKDIPIIFVTALQEAEAEIAGLQLGAVDYITKPIQVGTARQRIRNLLERERWRKQVQAQRDQLEAEVGRRLIAEKVIADSEEKFRTVADFTLNWEYWQGSQHELLYMSPSCLGITGYAQHDFIADPALIKRITYADDLALSDAHHHDVSNQQDGLLEFRLVRRDGAVRWIEHVCHPVHGAQGQFKGRRVSNRDITERKQAESRLQLAASVFHHAREGIIITDSAGCIVDVNEAFTRITGYSREEALGQYPSLLKSGRQTTEFYANLWADLLDKGHWSGQIWNRRKSGEVYAELLNINAVRNDAGQTTNLMALFTDITPMKDYEQQLEHSAHYDALTDLPNRALLSDRLPQAMAQSLRHGQALAVAFLDLDGFKQINDTHGHEARDELLIVLAQRMKAALREGDTLARIGGDEFVAVLVDLDRSQSIDPLLAPLLERLRQAAGGPVAYGTNMLQVSASMGVALFPQDGTDASALLGRADAAMYLAKQAGKNRIQFFDAKP